MSFNVKRQTRDSAARQGRLEKGFARQEGGGAKPQTQDGRGMRMCARRALAAHGDPVASFRSQEGEESLAQAEMTNGQYISHSRVEGGARSANDLTSAG